MLNVMFRLDDKGSEQQSWKGCAKTQIGGNTLMSDLIYKGFSRFNIMIEIALFLCLEALCDKDLNDRDTIPAQE